MARILIVDAASSSCMRLGLAVAGKGHETQMATSVEQAIELAARFRPEAAIIDWILDGEADGLEVAESIRALLPSMHAVLTTSHATRELREAALKARMFGFFEKPVILDRVLAGLEKAQTIPPLEASTVVGFIEFAAKGRILHASPRAAELLAIKAVGEDASLKSILSFRTTKLIADSTRGWFPLAGRDGAEPSSSGFLLESKSSNVLLVTPREDDALRRSRAIQILTGESRRAAGAWQPDGRVLLVDPDRLQRQLTTSQIRAQGIRFYSVDNADEALEAIGADPAIRFVLLDHAAGNGHLGDLVRRMRELRADIVVVGVSSGFRKREFEEIGVPRFSLKPTLAASLRQLLAV